MSPCQSGVTVSDPANKSRRSETDALGRLKQVVEDPSGLNYATNYTYSTTGNLIKVEQGTQYRYFLYDSASRLLRARNPEQNTNSNLALTPPSDQSTGNTAWALKYVYDANGNLTSKVDPRNVTTSYGYDALNRNIWTSYTDGITPTLERHYDAATNGKGRFYYHVSFNLHPVSGYAYSRTVVNAYDSMGRITSQSQGLLNAAATQWYDYTATRTYDLAGHVTGQTYPSSRTVSYSYAASGRLNSFSGGIGDGVTRTYADTFSYNAAGQVTKERFGTTTNLYHNQAYNNRLQLVENRLGTSSTDPATWNRGALINYYSNQARTANNQWLNATDNNGNVTRAEHYVPTDDAISSYSIPFRDDYDYDALNRITLVSGQQRNTGGSWASVYGQGNSYDRWGNRTINQATTWGTNINNTLYTVDAATNRFTQLSYDLAGSITSDTGNTREYDGENRMKKAWGGSQWNYYVYDADGKRVRRIIGSTETWQVYGLEGELIAEYPVNGAASTPQKEYGYRSGQMLIVGGCDVVRWIVADHLGTPRMEVDPSGSLTTMRRHDYLPFGEELLVGMGNGSIRTTGMGYTADCVRQRFTDKERDTETGLDYFEARYFASVQGRFSSPDPLMASGRAWNPQSWNRYSYVLNRPLNLIDPNGLLDEDPNDPQSGRKKEEQTPEKIVTYGDVPEI
ncbi:MAG: RHS repeat-associated core domain-containing protein, partial [Blastocatellia bacterium]